VRSVGAGVRPIDWAEKTGGTARYAADTAPRGALVARVLRSPLPHARIVSLDVAPALEVPGVRAVITAADFPAGVCYEHSGEPYSDRPPLARDRVLYVGQEVAAVAADTAEAAEEALRRIRVRYRRLPAVLKVSDALAAKAPRLHDRATGTNVSVPVEGSWGDPDAAQKASVASVTGRFRYPKATHVCMEPNTTVAWWHGGRLELWTSSQAPHFVVHELARVLDLELGQVVCRDVSVGGGFGSKSKVSEHEALAAMLSIKCGLPVLLALSRAEEFSATKPRHEFLTTLSVHVDSQDRVCWFDGSVDVDNGAFNHYGPSVIRAGIKQFGSMYRPDAATWRGRLVDTNLTPGGQFRGYGQPQTALAMECLIDELADARGLDPLAFRIHNASRPGSTALSGAKVGSNRLVECLETVRSQFDWDRRRAAGIPWRGVGLAAGMHASGSYAYPGGNTSAAGIEVTSAGDVVVRFGGADAGTGQRTILGQVAAEVLDVDFDRVRVIMTDWDQTPPDMGAWSSRGTHMGGHATKQTAETMAARLLELGAEKLGTSEVRLRDGKVESDADSVEIGDLAAIAPESVDGSLRIDQSYVEERMQPYWTGIERPNISASYAYAAHAVEVEVDPDTGEIRILDYFAAHDIGRAIHPGLTKGQIYGGIVQGLGPVLGEDLVLEHGRVVNNSYLHYPLPRSTTAPRISVHLVEGPEEAGPFDAKSVGEMAIIPPAPAILNAVHQATGIRFRALPLTPDVVLDALRAKHGAPRRPTRLWRRPDRWQIEIVRRLYPFGVHWLLHRFGTRFARRRDPRPIEAVHTPGTVAGVLAALDAGTGHRGDRAVIGGGTDLLAQRDQGLANPLVLVSTRSVTSLRTITDLDDGSVRIGAAVTLEELATWASSRIPALGKAVNSIASGQIRHTATVAGNLAQAKRCWFFRSGFDCYKRGGATCPCYAVDGDHRLHHAAIGAHRCQAVTPSDLATVFTALDAEVVVSARHGSRTTAIENLYSGPGELSLAATEIIEAIRLPHRDTHRTTRFEKLQLWDGDFALVSLAASWAWGPGGTWCDPRLVFGGIAPTPWSATRAERALHGVVPSATRIESAVEDALARAAHPLPGTAWKLDAALGLARRIATTLEEADR